jgi:hypothetical protein
MTKIKRRNEVVYMAIKKYQSIYERNLDQTGPEGEGPQTGLGLGPCGQEDEEKDNLEESCPEGSIAVGGACKSKSTGGRLTGKCDVGFTWDPKQRKCIKLSK